MNRLSLWIRALLTALIVFLTSKLTNTMPYFWLSSLSALFLVNLQIQDSFLKNQYYILITGLILILMLIAGYYSSFNIFLFAGFLFTTVFLGVYIGLKNSVLMYPALGINFFCTMTITPLFLNLHNNLKAVFSGLIISLIVRVLVWPTTLRNEIQRLYADYFHALQVLQKQIFDIYINRDYNEQTYVYEKALHIKRFAALEILNNIRTLTLKLSSHRNNYHSMVNPLENLFAHIVSLGNLRYRIKDYSTLEVCETELKQSTAAIQTSLHLLVAKEKIKKIQTVIAAFEEIYQTTLQMITHDPWIFLIFILNIKNVLFECKLISEQSGAQALHDHGI